MTDITGIQLQPWAPSTALVDLAVYAAESFETVWVAQQLQSRNTFTLLGAMTGKVDANLGSAVTFPFGHHPVELAGTFGALSELVQPGRKVLMGVGTGGGMVDAVTDKEKPITRVRELIEMCRALWTGEPVSLAEYPASVAATDLRGDCQIALNFTPAQPIPIIVTGIGPKILELAGETADGILFASNIPPHSLGSFRAGRWADASHITAVERGRSRSQRPFTRTYGLNVSIAKDRDAARAVAMRQAVLLVSGMPAAALQAAGYDSDSCKPVKEALSRGDSMEAAARLIPDEIADGLIISGNAQDCIPKLAELLEYIDGVGFDDAYIGAPVGPNTHEAIQLLADEVLPALRSN
jgi:5,10-methylenetetrahydromethanopterin reductase